MRTLLVAAVAGFAVAAGYHLTPGRAADPGPAAPAAAAARLPAPVPAPPVAPERLVAHEWGTFTSFSGSDGVPAGFTPNNTDLPHFVHYPNYGEKAGRLFRGGTISMETPVIYFYTDRETKVSVKVDFPRGWITEWYPFASGSPERLARNDKTGGQTIRWDARLLPGESVRFPRDESKNPYYHARETDSAALQTEVVQSDDDRDYGLRGGTVVQREKFLFYRGVGTFPPPVTVQATGGGKVRVFNSAGGKVGGLVLVSVRGGKVGFRPVGELDSGAETVATIPEADGRRADLAELLVKELIAAGLYEKEAKAMVKTWDAAWFGEEGTRLLYLVPRAKTDELLPLTVEPKPTEVVRVLVGRHDFLTPEQEATAERQVERANAARAELDAAEQELAKLGRFAAQARQMAQKRLGEKAVGARR